MSRPTAAADAAVAPLQGLLGALGDPVRLEMVRRLMAAGTPQPCVRLYDSVGKSTASHHFKLLRETGIIERHVVGGQVHLALRIEALDAAYPGVVRSIVAAAEAQRA
ncbi:MAG: helix-turn-helix domain-containing protein [Lapillicoccus sp.]